MVLVVVLEMLRILEDDPLLADQRILLPVDLDYKSGYSDTKVQQ